MKNKLKYNLSEEEARELEEEIKAKADKIAESATKKVEPFNRIITLLGLVGASIFLAGTLIRGSYEGGVRLLFVQLGDTTIVYIALAVMIAITLWHLVSTIRFFKNRNDKK